MTKKVLIESKNASKIPSEDKPKINLRSILQPISKYFRQMKISTNSEEINKISYYMWGNQKMEVLFKKRPIFLELEKIFTESFTKYRKKVVSFIINWFKTDFAKQIPMAQSTSITSETLYNMQVLSIYEKAILKFQEKNDDVDEKTNEFLEILDEMMKAEKDVSTVSKQNIDLYPDQARMEYDVRINEIKDYYESLRHEIGVLLYFFDIIEGNASLEFRDYIYHKLGPNNGLYKYRKIWNNISKKYEPN